MHRFLGVDASSGLVVANKDVVLEDELFKLIPRCADGQGGGGGGGGGGGARLEPAARLRVGCRTLEEREALIRLQARERARRYARIQPTKLSL